MAISRPKFAQTCVRQSLRFGVNPHYLMAVAELRSGISDEHSGDRFSVYRLTQQEWDANCSDAGFEISDFLPEDVKDWDFQCVIYALMTRRAQDRLLDGLGRYPSALELYEEQWPDEKGAGLADRLQAALDKTVDLVEPAGEKVVGETPSGMRTIEKPKTGTEPVTPEKAKVVVAKGEELFAAKAPQIMERLIDDFGFSDFQAAGILGNIGHECGGFRLMQEIKPTSGKGGFGWCQWTGSRRAGFMNFCNNRGLDPTSDAGNYGYLKHELQGSEKRTVPALKATTTLKQAVRVFEEKFERSGVKHLDRRDHWADLALKVFKRALPPGVTKVLDPDLHFDVVARATRGGTTYWVVDQFWQGGGQALIAQAEGEEPKVLLSDTSVFPLPAGLVPGPVAETLSRKAEKAGRHGTSSASEPAGDAEIARAVFAKAKECDETLVTRNVAGTSNGKLACAWAVNEVVNRATGKPVGGGLSTIQMGKALKDKHKAVTGDAFQPGMIVISPTEGRNVGHVGIVGAIANPRSDTVIYSNSSSRAVFSHHFTVAKWIAFYGKQKGLPVLYYALKKGA